MFPQPRPSGPRPGHLCRWSLSESQFSVDAQDPRHARRANRGPGVERGELAAWDASKVNNGTGYFGKVNRRWCWSRGLGPSIVAQLPWCLALIASHYRTQACPPVKQFLCAGDTLWWVAGYLIPHQVASQSCPTPQPPPRPHPTSLWPACPGWGGGEGRGLHTRRHLRHGQGHGLVASPPSMQPTCNCTELL